MGEYELLDTVRSLQDKNWEWRDKIENILIAVCVVTCMMFIMFFILQYKIRNNKKVYVSYVIVVTARYKGRR